jgi:acetylornithine deacetylase/succinyl-diaminopimelate desuccinylase-like protein
VVPSSFRIMRQLLSRLEDPDTGVIVPDELYVQIPPQRAEQARRAAKVLGKDIYAKFPFVQGMRPVSDDLPELVLNRTWRPTLSFIGVDGVPAIGSAGNVLRPATSAKLSLRVPPTVDADKAGDALKELVEADPPYGAKVTFEVEKAGTGWDAPPLAGWLRTSVDKASQVAFGRGAAMMGEGGSIPFMGMLGEKYPKAQFVITGVLGPHSNAHGPNEFLHIAMGKGVTLAVSQVLADHFVR